MHFYARSTDSVFISWSATSCTPSVGPLVTVCPRRNNPNRSASNWNMESETLERPPEKKRSDHANEQEDFGIILGRK